MTTGSLFTQLDMGKRSMMAQQSGMSTAGHNIANIDNENYSRQRVDLDPQHALRSRFGAGVDIVQRGADGRRVPEQAPHRRTEPRGQRGNPRARSAPDRGPVRGDRRLRAAQRPQRVLGRLGPPGGFARGGDQPPGRAGRGGDPGHPHQRPGAGFHPDAQGVQRPPGRAGGAGEPVGRPDRRAQRPHPAGGPGQGRGQRPDGRARGRPEGTVQADPDRILRQQGQDHQCVRRRGVSPGQRAAGQHGGGQLRS